jgi:hypothetical protein
VASNITPAESLTLLDKFVWQLDQLDEHLDLALQGPLTTGQEWHLKYARVITIAMRVLFDDERLQHLATVAAHPAPTRES